MQIQKTDNSPKTHENSLHHGNKSVDLSVLFDLHFIWLLSIKDSVLLDLTEQNGTAEWHAYGGGFGFWRDGIPCKAP